MATTPGKVIATLEATYNIGVGAAGVDPTQHNRAMSPLERTTRVMGGIATAAGVSQNLGGASKSATAEVAEAITPEGVRVRVPVGKTTLEKTADPLEISISADEANFDHIKIGKKPPYGGTRARDIVLQKDTVFVRVHGDNNQARSWMMRAEDIEV